ncbi:MAG TPA: VCBS repeat-containing protein [Myxococcota bacterium]
MRRLPVLVLLVFALAAALWGALWRSAPDAQSTADAARDVEARVRAACSTCHPFPPPDILPRSLWRVVIGDMVAAKARVAPRSFSMGFSVEEASAWYESQAPEKLPLAYTLTRRESGPLRFRRRQVRMGPDSEAGIATVQPVDASVVPGADLVLAAPNMTTGGIHLITRPRGVHRIAEGQHPARVASGDMDGDGLADLVVSDLGNPLPTEDRVGRVRVGINRGNGDFAFETVLDGVGRVADARPVDLEGDGDLDLVVAAFGWLRSGGIYLLYNQTRPAGPLDFRVEKISHRPGAVSVLPVEGLGVGPGRGLAVAFSQHYELVSLFYERAGRYEEHVVYRGPHPNWGVDNLSAVDFDGDSDTDFLLAHGDTLDDGFPFKFYHGVEWIENLGNAQFRAHRVGSLYGAHSAQAVDLDGDGDLDVVASSFLPQVNLSVSAQKLRLDSIVWFERTEAEWIPWSIELNHPLHTGIAVVDFDQDGLPDIVAAVASDWELKTPEPGPSVEVFFNEGAR